jgi:hypothetical protein
MTFHLGQARFHKIIYKFVKLIHIYWPLPWDCLRDLGTREHLAAFLLLKYKCRLLCKFACKSFDKFVPFLKIAHLADARVSRVSVEKREKVFFPNAIARYRFTNLIPKCWDPQINYLETNLQIYHEQKNCIVNKKNCIMNKKKFYHEQKKVVSWTKKSFIMTKKVVSYTKKVFFCISKPPVKLCCRDLNEHSQQQRPMLGPLIWAIFWNKWWFPWKSMLRYFSLCLQSNFFLQKYLKKITISLITTYVHMNTCIYVSANKS